MNPAHPRTILVTGCSSGIGRSVALGLKQRGYQVFATARTSRDLDSLGAAGLVPVRLELNDSVSIRNAVAEVLHATNGQLTALFNNAGYSQPGAVEDLSREVLRQQFETNLFGSHELTRRVIRVMRQQGYGRIIQNSSVLGLIALPYRGAYIASKYALEGLTDTLRMELHGSGIHVSLVEPGPIRSNFRKNALAMLHKNIDLEHSAHSKRYAGQLARLGKEGDAAPFTLPPEAVLDKVLHALEARRPQLRYYVTIPTYLFGTLRRLLSTGALDRILRRVSRAESS